jgi:hypothetical protein
LASVFTPRLVFANERADKGSFGIDVGKETLVASGLSTTMIVAQLSASSDGVHAVWRRHANAHARIVGAHTITPSNKLARVPRLVATDARFYSARNEAAAKAMGVRRVCIPNRSSRSVERKREQKKRSFRNGQKWRTGE